MFEDISFSNTSEPYTILATIKCSECETIEVAIANTEEEINKAYHLVYKAYLKLGFINCSEEEFRAKKYRGASDTKVFIGLMNNKLLMSISAYYDKDQGLPADKVFPSEVQKLRAQGKRLVEVGALTSIHPNNRASIQFIREIINYHVVNNYDISLSLIHPDHARIYKHIYKMETLTDAVPYDEVNGSPAVLGKIVLSR